MWKCPGASEDWGNFNWSENETSSVLHWCSPGAKHSAELIQHGVEFVLQLLQQITGLCIQLTVKDGELLHRQTLLLRCLLSHDWSGSVLMGWQGGRQQGQRRGTCLLVASLLSCLTPVLNTNGQLTSYQEPGHLPSLWSRSRSVKSSRSEHNYTSEGNTSHWSKPVSSQCKSVGLRHKLMLRETLNKCWRDVSTEHVLLRLCLWWTCGERVVNVGGGAPLHMQGSGTNGLDSFLMVDCCSANMPLTAVKGFLFSCTRRQTAVTCSMHELLSRRKLTTELQDVGFK